MWGDPVMKVPKKNLTGRKKAELQDTYGEDAIHESDVPIETRVLVDLYDDNEISEGHRRFFYDIEVSSEGGFPDPQKALRTITSMAYYDEASDRSVVLILDEDDEISGGDHSDIEIYAYADEESLLRAIIDHWREADPTIITGWNVDRFDNPYLYNRLKRVLGESEANKLSPIEKVREKRISGADDTGYEFAGISSLDYYRIYQNFTFTEEASYSLDHISNKELDRGKVEYEGMEVDGETIQDLDDLKRLDIDRFIKYNYEDVQLVVDIDEKLNFIEMARFISHLGHVPYEDVYMSSRFIEGAILNRLHKKGVVAPDNERGKTTFKADGRHRFGAEAIQVQKDEIHDDVPKEGTIGVDKASTKTKREKVDYTSIEGDKFVLKNQLDFEVEDGGGIGLEFAGAYVKEPNAGTYEWIYDLDLTSMYPCIIMGLNVSPETKVAKVYDWSVKDFVTDTGDKSYKMWVFDRNEYKRFSSSDELQAWVEQNNYSIAANGAVYRNDRRGIIAEILEDWFENRQEYKAKRNEARERGDEEKAEYYDKQQHNRKILINSVYGVLGLPVFRFYDIDNAEAVTLTGQSTIKYTQLMGDTYYKKHGDTDMGLLNECIYTDTDSVFYSAVPLLDRPASEMSEDDIISATIEKATELQEYLNDSYNYYARNMLNIPEGQHRFDIKQELVASRGLWMSAKKRYAQWIVNDEGDPTSELDVKGMDIVRSDFPPAFDSVMEEVVITILKENDQEKVDRIILDFEDKLHDFNIEEVANPTGVGSASDYQKETLGQYKKGAPVYFKSALAYNDLLDYYGLTDSHEPISDDSKIKWVYLHDNPLGLDQVGFKGDGDPKEIMEFIGKYADYDKMYEKALKSKLEDIYDAVDWKFPSAGKKKAEEFFQF
jgi:DNA polymerase elongation subunit (family B)